MKLHLVNTTSLSQYPKFLIIRLANVLTCHEKKKCYQNHNKCSQDFVIYITYNTTIQRFKTLRKEKEPWKTMTKN
eukprot:Pgem_evm1s9327